MRRPFYSLILCSLLTAACGSAQVVISQVYGGGGNAGAALKNDFVELFNAGSSSVDLTDWSVQYASSSGSAWQVTPISGILTPGQYFLVQEAAGSGGTTNLPTPDASGTIAMSATAGKVALVASVSALSGSCPDSTAVQDLLAFGSGSCSNTAPGLSNTTADLRKNNGCAITGVLADDFAAGVPNPHNIASPLNPCADNTTITLSPATLNNAVVNVAYSITLTADGGTPPYRFDVASGQLPANFFLSADGQLTGTAATTAGLPFTFTVSATDSIGNTGTNTYSLQIDPGAGACAATATIAQVQGSGNTSPLNGQTVTVSGIVTGSNASGFFIQMPSPGDGDPSTSDGVYVFTGSSSLPTAATTGNLVCVTGPVTEYVPAGDSISLSSTEINRPTLVAVMSSGNPIPPPVTLTTTDTDPNGGLYQLEKYEGMRVQIDTLNVVAPTQGRVNEANATSSSTGIFYGVLPGLARPFREPGIQAPEAPPGSVACCIPVFDANPEIISVASSRLPSALEVTTGATVSRLMGELQYNNDAFTIDLEPASGASATGNRDAVPVPAADSSQLTISSFNLEHFYNSAGADPGTSHATLTPTAFNNRLSKASLAIRNILQMPDILGLEEVQNSTTLQALADRINSDAVAAGQANPNYQPYLPALGNDISGINSCLLVKSPKVQVNSVTQYGKAATFANASGSQAILNDRPPVVLDATVLRDGSDTPLRVFVVVNHLRSLLSLDTDPTVRLKREAQAEYLANLIQSLQQLNPDANAVSIGDYNAYQFNDGYVDTVGVVKGAPAPSDQVVLAGPSLVSPALTDLVDTALIPAGQKYSYTFSGSAQAIDHIVVTPSMLNRATALAYARLDADYPDSYRNDPTRPERISDHDAPVAYFTLPLAVTSKMNFASSGFTYSRVTKTYAGTLTITNNTSSTVAGPLYIAFTNLPSDVTLVSAAGTAQGGSYVSVGVTSSLAPGQSATVGIQFNDPSNTKITFSPVVYSGSF